MVFSLNSRLTSALLAVCANAPAWAQDDPGFKVKADYTLVSDSNLFRLPAGANVLALTGRSSASEQISVYGAGFSYRGAHSLQRFELDLTLHENRYQNFSHLNFTAGKYNAAWRWSLTPRTYGTLSHEHSEALNSFADDQTVGRSNKRTITYTRLDATHELSGPWRVVGGMSQQRQTNQQVLTTEGDYSARAADVGIRYIFASGSSFTYSHKNTSASYLNRTLPSAGLFDDGYDQRDDELRAHWVITGKSTLDASAAHTSRTHPHYPERNYSGLNANTSLRWSFSGKAALVAGLQRELASYQSSSTNFTQTDRLSLGPVWQISPKTALRLNLQFAQRDYLGMPTGAVANPRHDTLRDATLALEWKPNNALTVSTSLQDARRRSNQAGLDYNASLITVTAQYAY
jgi:exopolysaccharide biosynthesis operon protein EpsL